MYQVRVVEEQAERLLLLTGPDGRTLRAALGEDLTACADALRRDLAEARVEALAVEGLPLVAGYALGRWAPTQRWALGEATPFARLEGEALVLGAAGAEPVRVALPPEVEAAAAVLAGASRAWPEVGAAGRPRVSDAGLAAGIVLGIVLGEQEPEVRETGPAVLPTAVERTLSSHWFELVLGFFRDTPTERVIEAARGLLPPGTDPRAFDRWIARARERAEAQKAAVEEVVGLAKRLGPDAPEVLRAGARYADRFRWKTFLTVVHRRLEKEASHQRYLQQRRAPVVKTSRVRASGIDHRIHQLEPAAEWTLYIDESGDGGKNAFDRSRADLPQGHEPWLVGVLVPKQARLKGLPPGFHARDLPPDALDAHMQDLLDAPVGVIGLKVSSQPRTHGNLWFLQVMELVHWTAQLLPLTPGQATLEVCIEQRGDYKPSTSPQVAEDTLMRHLSAIDKDRGERLAIKMGFVLKDASQHLGYADLVAFGWGRKLPHTKAMMAQSGLLGTCLIGGDAAEMRRDWEALGAGRMPDVNAWLRLMESSDARVPGSLTRMMLDRVAEKARADAGYWRSLCEGVIARLDGRDVRLVVLGGAVAELEACLPAGQGITPRLELAFRTARLAHANHLGAVELAEVQALEALCTRLFEEVPALVCQADLVRAVTHTNHFDFAGATAAIARWQGQRPEVAGLQHHGRVLSTLGQHAAFRGEAAEARRHFEEALACFSRLSEPDMAEREAWQTGTYLALATQDDATCPAKAAQAALAARAGDLSPAGIASWPGKERDAYLHHALLRWLVDQGSPEARAAYLGVAGTWETQAEHPWELIEAYRGLLCWEAGDRDMAEGFLASGVELALAPGQGPTVRYIGVTLARLASRTGLQAEPLDAALVPSLREVLPLAPWAAWDEEGELPDLPAAWAWLGRVLPFNFR